MAIRILILDNYDSFTYNLVHLVEKILHQKVDVILNDRIDMGQVVRYDKIILSPGPGIPSESGMLIPLIREWAQHKPMLGVCLGHQAIGECFGARLVNLEDVYHGVATDVEVIRQETPLFYGMPSVFKAGRYHSWVVAPEGLPDCFTITAIDGQGQIMAMMHNQLDLTGVQFHPESILTPYGETMIKNWLKS